MQIAERLDSLGYYFMDRIDDLQDFYERRVVHWPVTMYCLSLIVIGSFLLITLPFLVWVDRREKFFGKSLDQRRPEEALYVAERWLPIDYEEEIWFPTRWSGRVSPRLPVNWAKHGF